MLGFSAALHNLGFMFPVGLQEPFHIPVALLYHEIPVRLSPAYLCSQAIIMHKSYQENVIRAGFRAMGNSM